MNRNVSYLFKKRVPKINQLLLKDKQPLLSESGLTGLAAETRPLNP